MAQIADSVLPPYGNGTLPEGIRSRTLPGINGLQMHVLDAGFEGPDRPGLLLLHGFPELAYSWRELMLPLAAAGFHVIAPDRRGYGRTSGWDDAYDTDLQPFGALNQVKDLLALLAALGHRSVAAVIGHDYGSPLAAWCALLRPDVFRAVVLMSAPFTGAPPPPHAARAAQDELDAQLAALPRPRKYYMRYYTTREANADLQGAPQGLHAFLRAYFHHKSADWTANQPFTLEARTAKQLAQLPTYYVMDLACGMAATVAAQMPSPAQIGAQRWLPDAHLAVYTTEYGRTGFQGGLNEYRCSYEEYRDPKLQRFAGRGIEVASMFIGGRNDWGVYQSPGALQTMRERVCRNFCGVQLIEGAGHWVQQEQPARVLQVLLPFLARAQAPRG